MNYNKVKKIMRMTNSIDRLMNKCKNCQHGQPCKRHRRKVERSVRHYREFIESQGFATDSQIDDFLKEG